MIVRKVLDPMSENDHKKVLKKIGFGIMTEKVKENLMKVLYI